jgi:hypothetical protein
MRNVLAVCDVERDYARRFMEYLNQRRKLPFEIQAFTSAASLLAYAANRHIELLLISEKAMCADIEKMDAGKIIVLSGDGEKKNFEDHYPAVYKYQGAAQIVREVLDCYGAWQKAAAAECVEAGSREVIAFCPAGDQAQKTEAAAAAAKFFAEERKTLYINLERCSGVGSLMGTEYTRTLSDLLFYYRREKGRIVYRMDSIVRNADRLSFIPPVENYEDIDTMNGAQWAQLILELLRTGEYEVLVLDLDEKMICEREISRLCGKICIVTGESEVSRARCRALKETLGEILEEEEKICVLKMNRDITSGTGLFGPVSPALERAVRKVLGPE